MTFDRLVRFKPKSDPSTILIGQPVDDSVDVGLAVYDGKEVSVAVYSGSSILAAGDKTDRVETIGQLLAPLSREEVGTIRCIGLNYRAHAAEAKMDLPSVPPLFMKPATSLGDPYPTSTCPLPKLTTDSDSGDYESEMAVVLGRAAKNVSEADAMNYVLGWTAANDVSCRSAQFAQSQWGFSKGFDGACPLGPTVVSTRLVSEPGKMRIRGERNGETVQESGVDDLIFSVPKLIAFLSQGTTLPAGTVIVTGTPAGVGFARDPKVTLHDGDEFRVELTPHVGTLVTKFVNE